MKNLSRYDENLSVPRKKDVDGKQAKIDGDGILKGNGNGSVTTAIPGTDYALQSLGMSGAVAGQMPVVKNIDAQGRPVEWEPADVGGGSDVFIITVGTTTDNGNGTFSFTPDKTYEEVNTAILNKKQCYVKYNGIYYPLANVNERTSDDGAAYVAIAIFTVAFEGLAMRSITMVKVLHGDTATWVIQATETAASFPSNPSNGQVLYYKTGIGRGWHATNIGPSLATDFTGIIKGANGKIAQAEAGTDYMAPVAVTTADNGKFLRVVGGAWAAVSISDANGVSF